MIEINIKVAGQNAQALKRYSIVAGSVNDHEAIFTFDTSWDGMAKSVQFSNGTVHDERLLTNDRTLIPTTVISESGYLYIKPYAVVLDDTGHILERKKTTTPVLIEVTRDGLIDLTIPYPVTPTMYEELLGVAAQARDDAAQTAPLRDETFGFRNETEEFKTQTAEIKGRAVLAETNAKTSETNAKTSERNAGQSETVARQAMLDLLAMLGIDIATLINGKVPVSQIPRVAIHDTLQITDASELITLDAQNGDVGVVVVDGKITISYQLLGEDPTVRSNWVEFNTSYASTAGHAITADEALNATMINNHRMIAMTQEQYDVAVIDLDGTVYLVG